MSAYRITAADRRWYKRCRRAWDLGATGRRNLAPAGGEAPRGAVGAIADALAVYYFPGMWGWPRQVVLPKVKAVAPMNAALIDGYSDWASVEDDFEPIQVATGIEVNIPDPILSDRDLATVDGDPVRYATTQDALVFGADHRPWVMIHRIVDDVFASREFLALDGVARTDCWAWRQFSLDRRIAGVIFNEVALDGRFRRTTVGYSPEELDLAGRHLAVEALEMIDAGLAVYPSPEEQVCTSCPFRDPCLVMQSGGDPGPVIAEGYRARSLAAPVEGVPGGTRGTSGGVRGPNPLTTDTASD